MKTQPLKIYPAISILIFINVIGLAQVQIDTNVTVQQIVEKIIGPGIGATDNITYQGVNQARGYFSNAGSSLIGINNGIFLCTGSGANIPGPNLLPNAGTGNWVSGHPSLQSISTGITYDASVLEFDFIPMNDTLRCYSFFGSEEYNEHVNSDYNDLCAIFLTGPDPMGGYFNDKNIAIVPGTTNTSVSINNVNNGNWPPGTISSGPCTNCQYFFDNPQGSTLEYDGFVINFCWSLVIPYETYHIKFGIADVNGYGYDSGLFLEEQGLFFLGPAELTSYQFLMENNPGLSFDITGEIVGNDIYVEVPEGTALTNLVATYEDKGAFVYVDDVLQTSSVTQNDFTEPLIYTLQGHGIADYTVYVEIVTGIIKNIEPTIKVYPNPAKNFVRFDFSGLYSKSEIQVTITDIIGNKITVLTQHQNLNKTCKLTWETNDIPSGIYYYSTNIDGNPIVGKIIIQQ